MKIKYKRIVIGITIIFSILFINISYILINGYYPIYQYEKDHIYIRIMPFEIREPFVFQKQKRGNKYVVTCLFFQLLYDERFRSN